MVGLQHLFDTGKINEWTVSIIKKEHKSLTGLSPFFPVQNEVAAALAEAGKLSSFLLIFINVVISPILLNTYPYCRFPWQVSPSLLGVANRKRTFGGASIVASQLKIGSPT